MEQINLQAEPRKLLGKKVKVLRRKNQIPAILYGRKFPSIPLVLMENEFKKISQKAGESTIINLEMPREQVKALIRHIQKDSVTENIVHVDFYKIDMSRTLQTEIPLKFIGISAAVEELEGNLITNKDSIKVECLPEKLVDEIEIDVSVLKTFEDLIHIKDLKIPAGIKVFDEPDDVVLQVTPPLSEEELKALEEEGAAVTEKAQIENIEAEVEKERIEKEETPEQEKTENQPPTKENKSSAENA